jgi:hypothetical protein
MIKGAPISKAVHFEISIDDPERAAGFYRDALGWEISCFGAAHHEEVNFAAQPPPATTNSSSLNVSGPRCRYKRGVITGGVRCLLEDCQDFLDLVQFARGKLHDQFADWPP